MRLRGVWNSGYYFLYRRGIFCRDKKAEADSGFGHCARFLSARRNLFLFFVSDYVKIHKKTLKKCENVNEIIVINNNSSDNTKEIAQENGAIVYDCKKVGKGNAMTLGKTVATGDIILFIDADIDNYSENFINKMIEPILNDDYVYLIEISVFSSL